jgi:proline iminopeptidase
MSRILASATPFFESDASEERQRILRENLAKLPAGASMGQTLLAQTPLRFFDPTFDAAAMLEGAVGKPGFFQHLFGLTAGWDVTRGADDLRVPVFLAHGRYDYIVPHTLWDGVAQNLPKATFRLFEKSGHQPFFEEPVRFEQEVTEWMEGAGGE